MGDIGSHAESLVDYVTGLRIESLCADLHAFVPGRRLDDDGSVLLRFAGGARGTLVASQVAIGEENALRLRVYGERGALDWSQQEPNTLTLRFDDRPAEVRRTGGPGIGASAAAATRLPSGHPEGFLEAFANLYRGVAAAHAAREEKAAHATKMDVPGIDDALRGMQFIETVVESSRRGGVWLSMPSQ
jgi:predicted dehydrogenase